MANDIANQICDAVDLLIGKRVSSLQFDKTVRATILSVEDETIGKYRVRYQNSVFYAYSNPDLSYRPNTLVYVEIPSNDYNKDKIIIGSVKKIGTLYLTAVSALGRMTKLGTNILTNNKGVNFCSYKGQQTVNLLSNYIAVNSTDLSTYKTGSAYFMLGTTVQTSLPVEQQTGGGNYGIILLVDYYTTAEKESLGDNRSTVTRTYILDVNNMLGQPYKYTTPDNQYAIFEIDGDNLKGIKSIQAFCKSFPVTKTGQPDDIFLSDFEISFMLPLSDLELSTSSLKILTPYGSYFTSQNDDTKYLEAELKLKGKKVNFSQQSVDFYWFVKDTNVTASSKLYYSQLAGEGWRCLNSSQTYGGVTQFVPDSYRKHITLSMAPAKKTTFKCVAVYNDTTLSDTIVIQNNYSNNNVVIESSAGTQFYFDTGLTTLTCKVTTTLTNLAYHWGYRTENGNFVALSNTSNVLNNVNINIANNFVTYECTVYSGNNRIGTAEITLTNGTPLNEYTLVINNGTAVFKYDAYGVSPASNATAAANRIVIPTLSFDIYNDKGQIVTPATDAEKIRQCDIKWIWPDEDFTMLTHTFTLTDDKVVNPATNGNVLRRVLANSATLTFGIQNKYDIDATDNNIQLQVNFQGHYLVASTNFTFVKEGELGTNGTEYVSRIVPRDSKYLKVYLENGKVYGWYLTITKKYNSTTGKNDVTDAFTFTQLNGSALKCQLWNSGNAALYDSVTNTSTISATVKWELVDVGASTTHNATISTAGVITPNTSYANTSTVAKSTLQSSELSELARSYYATYPLDVVKTPGAAYHAIITGGFNECMYNSDGTRGSFNTKPFTLRIFNNNVARAVTASGITWTVSWYTTAKNNALKGKNGVTIEPPAFFDSTTTNNYIKATYSDGTGSYTVIISVHLYLNRYGLAAMNDWDGTSLKLNSTGDQYILAPQIGAGTKDNNNTFTGITMGKSFNVNGSKTDPEIGLMGFNKGVRSIFLDAETGRAMFGSSSSGQIVVSPLKYGVAPRGSIYSWNYYNHDSTGKPTSEKGAGMLIDLETPAIKFGSGHFSVDSSGNLKAKGDGSIASWKITDNYLQSVDGKTTLYAQNGPSKKITIDNVTSTIVLRFNIGNGKFVIYENGTFSASNSKFTVDAAGVINAVAGKIGGWIIDANTLQSSTKTTTLSSSGGNDAARINVNSKFIIYGDGRFLAANGSFSVDKTGKIVAKDGTIGGWNIGTSQLSSTVTNGLVLTSTGKIYTNNKSTFGSSNTGVYISTDGISLGSGSNNFSVNSEGSLIAKKGTVGNFTIDSSSIRSGTTNATGAGSIALSTANFTRTVAGASRTNLRFAIGSNFGVTQDGTLYASGVDITGTIKATGGEIGKWSIATNSLHSGSGTTYVELNSNASSTYAMWAGNATASSAPFRVSRKGLITSTSGKIGGWTINSSGLTSSSNSMYINSNGSIGKSGKWSIDTSGNATFNNITCTSTWNFGSGSNWWSNDGFNFGSGNYLSNNGFSFSGGGGSFNIGGFGWGGDNYQIGGDTHFGHFYPLSDGIGLGSIWFKTNGEINTPGFSCNDDGIAVGGAIGIGNAVITADKVRAWDSLLG